MLDCALIAADVVTQPSQAEGFGLATVEAMMAARPVVASNVCGLVEVVINGETGVLADVSQPTDYASALGRLLLDPYEADRLGQNGRLRAQQYFSADRMVAETVKVYRDVIGASS